MTGIDPVFINPLLTSVLKNYFFSNGLLNGNSARAHSVLCPMFCSPRCYSCAIATAVAISTVFRKIFLFTCLCIWSCWNLNTPRTGWQIHWQTQNLPHTIHLVLHKGRNKMLCPLPYSMTTPHLNTITKMVTYTVQKVIVFPIPSQNVTNQTLPGRKLLNYSWPGRFWLVTSRLGTE